MGSLHLTILSIPSVIQLLICGEVIYSLSNSFIGILLMINGFSNHNINLPIPMTKKQNRLLSINLLIYSQKKVRYRLRGQYRKKK